MSLTEDQKVIIRKWIVDLRSGEFEQTTGSLHRIEEYNDEDAGTVYKPGFCCLGVLCEQAVSAGVIENTGPNADGDLISYDGLTGMPPEEVAVAWAGLDRANPYVTYQGFPESLSQLNDTAGLNFNEIADLIEEQILNG